MESLQSTIYNLQSTIYNLQSTIYNLHVGRFRKIYQAELVCCQSDSPFR